MTAIAIPLNEAGVIPDIMVVERSALAADGPLADASRVRLVVEVVAPSTRMTDRRVKPELYVAAGIPHYWRVELRGFRGQLPGEKLPVLFAFALGTDGYELVHRVDAAEPVKLSMPYPVTIDMAALRTE